MAVPFLKRCSFNCCHVKNLVFFFGKIFDILVYSICIYSFSSNDINKLALERSAFQHHLETEDVNHT